MTEPHHEFTAGIEVHQQLDTGKLFCACPSDIRDDPSDFVIERELRPAVGESGQVDIAAAHEKHKTKRFRYHGYADTTCLVEIDEEPISQPNPRAVALALQVAKLLELRVVDEAVVMRKTVVDGSNTSGFQRTMLVGLDGTITVDNKPIRIEQLCLEEDSCKIITRGEQHDDYNLSRLGIPLLEITTGPDLHTPQQVKNTAAYLGMVLRSTGKVKRGLGTIRQDLNVSVPGGARVEIKGAQDLDSLGILVATEAARQRALINLTQIIPKQEYAVSDATDAIHTTGAAFIQSALKRGHVALGVRLAGWKETLGSEIMPGVRVGKELAGYAKTHGFGGLIHSSEDLAKYPLTEQVANIRSALHCGVDDGWIVMIGERTKLLTFLDHVLIPRLQQLSVGVPQEVRKAEADGTTSYLRPMPGASRMYPETDARPVELDPDSVTTPKLLTERAKELEAKHGLSADLAQQLAREEKIETFEAWLQAYPNVSASISSSFLVSREKEIKTRHNIDISEDIVRYGEQIFPHLNAGTIAVSSIEPIILELHKGNPIDWSAYKTIGDDELELVIGELIRENPGAKIGLLMGKVMRHFNNRADGKRVQEILRARGVQ